MADEKPPAKPAAKPVEMVGTVSGGMMAIGGETTGTVLRTESGESYELEMRPEHRSKFEGKKVRVIGDLREQAGVEIGSRRIISVSVVEEIRE